MFEDLKKPFDLRCRYWRTDKYGRSMFEVDDEKLSELYDYCMENNKDVSLFKVDGNLIMVVSNYKLKTLKGANLTMNEYKGAYRFYANKYEWEETWL